MSSPSDKPARPAYRGLTAVLVVWVAGSLGLYLYTFKDIIQHLAGSLF